MNKNDVNYYLEFVEKTCFNKYIVELNKTDEQAKNLVKSLILHSKVVGESAKKLAYSSKILDHNLAYACENLHDIGRIDLNRFHGLAGYEFMLNKNERVAKICLTHTFVNNKVERFQFNNESDFTLQKI